MFKTMHLMKRRPGMTHQEFVEYYETRHFKFMTTIQDGGVTKYVRRFPIASLNSDLEPEWDCIMELWWESSEARDRTFAELPTDLARIINEDEVQLFDLDSMLIYSYEESATELPVTEVPPTVAAYWARQGGSEGSREASLT